MALSIGDVAPSFEVNIDGSGKFSLSEAKGSLVVLYFYPKDDTPGCTTVSYTHLTLPTSFLV